MASRATRRVGDRLPLRLAGSLVVAAALSLTLLTAVGRVFPDEVKPASPVSIAPPAPPADTPPATLPPLTPGASSLWGEGWRSRDRPAAPSGSARPVALPAPPPTPPAVNTTGPALPVAAAPVAAAPPVAAPPVAAPPPVAPPSMLPNGWQTRPSAPIAVGAPPPPPTVPSEWFHHPVNRTGFDPVPDRGPLLAPAPGTASPMPRAPAPALPVPAPAPRSPAGGLPLPTPPSPQHPAPLERAAPGVPVTMARQAKDPLPPPIAMDDLPDTPERRAALGAARAAAGRNDLPQAISRYRDYLKQYPGDQAVRREYAGILQRAGELEAAIEQYQQLATALPDNAALRTLLADALLAARRPRQAIPNLLFALERSKNDPAVAAKLAQAYVADFDLKSARGVFDRYLSQLKPGDPKVPDGMGSLLLDLGRPKEALAFLVELRAKKPDDANLLSDTIRAYARVGLRDKAAELLGELVGRAPRDANLRITLGDALYGMSEFQLAGLAYSQALQIEPTNLGALIGMARVDVQEFRPQVACKFLESCVGDPAHAALLALARGEYHQSLGESAEAVRVLREYLRHDEADAGCRNALAAVYLSTGDREKAKAEYAKLALLPGQADNGQLGVARALAAQRKFHESDALCDQLLGSDPNNAGALAQLIRNLGQENHVERAVSLGHAFLGGHPQEDSAVVTVVLAIGRVLLDHNRYAEAAKEYETVVCLPLGRTPETANGLAYAFEKLGQHEKAREVLVPVLSGSVRDHVLLADAAAAFNLNALAAEAANGVLAKMPQHLAALLRLAEAQQRDARKTALITEAVATCHTILTLSPTNVRGRFDLARTLAIGLEYLLSAAEYEKLVTNDPDLTQARKEWARVLYAAGKYYLAHQVYASAQHPTAEEVFQARLAEVGQHDARLQQALQPALVAGSSGVYLKGEVDKVSAVQGADGQAMLKRATLDEQARAAEVAEFQQEDVAKDLKGSRNRAAVAAYQTLLGNEPTDVDGLFDLSQTFGALNRTHAAINTNLEILNVDPYNRDAATATERAGFELQPKIDNNTNLFFQNGRDGLARIERDLYQTTAVLPLGDETDFFGIGYTRATYIPHDDRPLSGNILSLLGGRQLSDTLRFLGQVDYQVYPNRLKDRFTYDVRLQNDFSDAFTGYFRSFLAYVLENGETLRQDIYRYGGEVGGLYRFDRFWNATGYYRLLNYSDNNVLNEGYLATEYTLLPAPYQLRTTLSVNYLDYSNPRSTAPPGASLVGLSIPYFAPSNYFFYQARLSYTQFLSRDLFKYSNQAYYTLEYALAFDSNSANYNIFRLKLNYDIRSWITVGADATVTLSPGVYNAAGGFAYIEFRTPPWR
jgi:predicted Zn-dependent protease